MSSLNRCEFIGNLGKEPETRFMTNGGAVCSFSIACNEKWKDKATGEQKEHTEWVNLTAFGKLAEICQRYLKKGQQVYVAGKFKTDKYEKDGQTHYSTKVIINEMKMLGVKGTEVAGNDAASQAAPSSQNNDFDDDIPF